MSYRKTRRDLRRIDKVTVAAGGATAAKGLSVVANANGTGSDLIVTVWGLVK